MLVYKAKTEDEVWNNVRSRRNIVALNEKAIKIRIFSSVLQKLKKQESHFEILFGSDTQVLVRNWWALFDFFSFLNHKWMSLYGTLTAINPFHQKFIEYL